MPSIAVIIPALNEEEAIPAVLAQVPSWATSVVVVDNGSTDATAERARAAGAQVVQEPRRGYGRACLAGLRATGGAEIIVFLDADLSDFPEEMARLVEPVVRDEADLVMGAREGVGRPGHAQVGTALCLRLINGLWAHELPRPRSVSCHSASGARSARHAGPDVGLDDRDAGEGRRDRSPGCRGADSPA